MKLKNAHIQNFRSIRDLNIDFTNDSTQNCHIFLGINESGKSNILRALALLNKTVDFNYERDCEKEAKKRSAAVSVSYEFELDRSELEKISQILANAGVPENIVTLKKIKNEITVATNGQRSERWIFLTKDNLEKTKYGISDDFKKMFDTRTTLDTGNEPNEENLQKLYTTLLGVQLTAFIPKILYWKREKEYLISRPISLRELQTNPNTSIPLKNMFALIGINDSNLSKNIERVFSNDASDRRSIQRQLSKTTTAHINKIWKDHRVSIDVNIDRDGTCNVGVYDVDNEDQIFNMEDRSEGFKQFVSILLTLSVEARQESLKNAIILLDEPDSSLHPGGVLCLKDELLQISELNTVVVATHSVFLVDRKNLSRHVRVFKEEGSTKAERIRKDNPFCEDVLYRALGTTLFEMIEPNMLILEGTTDKDIFEALRIKLQNKVDFPAVTVISAGGANQVKKYLEFFKKLWVTGRAIFDSDNEGKSQIANIERDRQDLASLTTEIFDFVKMDKEAATVEDLLPIELITTATKNLYGSILKIELNKRPILEEIKKAKEKAGISRDHDLSELKSWIAKSVITEMKLDEKIIEKRYSIYAEFLNKVASELKSASRVTL